LQVKEARKRGRERESEIGDPQLSTGKDDASGYRHFSPVEWNQEQLWNKGSTSYIAPK
jgi:hypothetical protein